MNGQAFEAIDTATTERFLAPVRADSEHPSQIVPWGYREGEPLRLIGGADGASCIGYVDRTTVLSVDGNHFQLKPGMFFATEGVFTAGGGRGLVFTRPGYRGSFLAGGPVEERGRLRYIDGCTDSLLVPPNKLGDPCLNLLYFPPGINQTMHTHPSERLGMVLSGRGRCHYAGIDGEPRAMASRDLEPGMVFCIHANGQHCFSTPYGDSMRVLAWHPDTDVGPSDEAHPMLNRTIIEGVSAADPARAQYRTRVAPGEP